MDLAKQIDYKRNLRKERIMDIKKLILEMKKTLASLTGNDDWKKNIEAQITELEKLAAEIEETKPIEKHLEQTPPEKNSDVIALKEEIASIKDMLLQQKQRADAAEAAMKEQQKNEFQKKIEGYKKKIVDDGKVTPAELKEKWETLLNSEATFDAASKIIDGLPVNPASKKTAGQNEKPKPVGIMKSANPTILGKVLEYSNSNTN